MSDRQSGTSETAVRTGQSQDWGNGFKSFLCPPVLFYLGGNMGRVCRFPNCNTILSQYNKGSNFCFCHHEVLESNNYCYIGNTFRKLGNNDNGKGGVVWNKVPEESVIGLKSLRQIWGLL